jgi:hypothetical protein
MFTGGIERTDNRGSFMKVMLKMVVFIGVVVSLGVYIWHVFDGPVFENQNVMLVVSQFQAAVDSNQANAAWSMLAVETKPLISQDVFQKASGDYEVLVQAFRSAGIDTQPRDIKDVVSSTVPNYHGQKGSVRFVTVNENGVWKIANLIQSPTP